MAGGSDFDNMINLTDDLLYRAKSGGRSSLRLIVWQG
jgi:PleD family two-component response regulator